jgi:hypothetical protein
MNSVNDFTHSLAVLLLDLVSGFFNPEQSEKIFDPRPFEILTETINILNQYLVQNPLKENER